MAKTSILHLPPPERANYLKMCWRTGRLQEGVREWTYPTRYRFYRWRKALGKDSNPGFRFDPTVEAPRDLSATVPILFAPSSSLIGCRLDGLSSLFSEVDAQLQGTYRLAGAHHQDVNNLDLSTLPDNEHHHAYHRLYWAVRYTCAAAFGHPQAEDGLCRDLARWLSADWKRDRRVAYPYTTAERIASLAEVAFWIGCGGLAEAGKWIIPIKEHVYFDAVHLSRNVEYWLAPHNHLLNDARALYIASVLLPECAESSSWRQLAFELWDENFAKLVMEDGSFGEETSFYLFMSCRTALEYVLAARRYDHVLLEGLYVRLRLMLELGNDLLRGDGSLPRFGNSSPDHIIRDLWGLMAAAHSHGLLLPSPRDNAVTPLTLYYCGDIASSQSVPGTINEINRLSLDKGGLHGSGGYPNPPTPPSDPLLVPGGRTSAGEATIRLYPEGGWAFLRKPELDAELVINGDTRPMTRGHGDCGRGSFELWWRGTLLIRDPGNPTYNLPARHWYRSGQGQNVTCVNGLPPGISHEYQERMPNWYCEVQAGTWQVNGKSGVTFHCKGFRRLLSPVDWERQWVWNDSRRLVMRERLEGQGSVQLDSYLHLGDAPWSEFSSQEWRCDLPVNAQHSGFVRMMIEGPAGTGTMRRPARFAPEYGIEKDGSMLVISGKAQLPVSWSVTWEFE